MATIHFIWWGPYKGDMCVKMPNEVADKCRDHQVQFWCKWQEAEEFAMNLDRNRVRWDTCDSIKDIVGQNLYNGPGKKWFDDAQDVLTYLDSVRAYSAVKDLLSLIILYAKGGYYFDTTTLFPPGSDGSKLNTSLKTPLTVPRVVGFPGSSKRHQVLIQTAESITSGLADIPYFQTVELIDVWAMFSPALDLNLLLMFMSYVSRCNRMGLYPNGTPSNFDGLKGDEVIRDQKAPGRNVFIGNLIIRSVYDGLLVVGCDGVPENLKKFYWKLDEINTESEEEAKKVGNLAVPDLGINKYYAGSWREVSADSKVDKKDSKENK